MLSPRLIISATRSTASSTARRSLSTVSPRLAFTSSSSPTLLSRTPYKPKTAFKSIMGATRASSGMGESTVRFPSLSPLARNVPSPTRPPRGLSTPPDYLRDSPQVRPDSDKVLQDIADYVHNYEVRFSLDSLAKSSRTSSLTFPHTFFACRFAHRAEQVKSDLAYNTARLCLIDTIGCGLEGLRVSEECRKLMEPIVPGTVVPNGTRVPGTEFQMDPVSVELFLLPLSLPKCTDEREQQSRCFRHWYADPLVGLQRVRPCSFPSVRLRNDN